MSSFSKEPIGKFIEERQVLLSPGDVSVCQEMAKEPIVALGRELT